MIQTGHGNLLKANADALVNTVNTVGVAGKGIALQFRTAFPENHRAYVAACKRGEVVPGRVHVFETGQLVGAKYIINFPTKRHWRARSRLADIETGLADLRRVIQELRIRSIALPPLGCGNGGLDWTDVAPRIHAALAGLDGVEVVLFEPSGAPSNDEMPVATKRPALTAQRAAMIALFERYLVPDYKLTALEAQKLAYFLQVLGQPMRLNFVKGQFGPYAENLNHALQAMEGHYTRGYGDRSSSMALHVLPGSAAEAEQFLESDEATRERVAKAASIVMGFETPYGLELLTTVHWAAAELGSTDLDSVVDYVAAWTSRKSDLFTPTHIEKALARLAHAGLVTSEPG